MRRFAFKCQQPAQRIHASNWHTAAINIFTVRSWLQEVGTAEVATESTPGATWRIEDYLAAEDEDDELDLSHKLNFSKAGTNSMARNEQADDYVVRLWPHRQLSILGSRL